jgi:hypothetical protein
MSAPIVSFPQIVTHYAHFYEEVFSEEAFIQFKRYISGLLISENKTIDGMNRLFVNEERNQSSLNRLLTKYPWSITELNKARLEMLASVPRTQMKKTTGVLGVDDSLLSHYGKKFEQIAKLWNHAENRYVWAHNLVTLHYSDEQTDYPIANQLWKPADLEKLEVGLPKAGINLKENKFALKETSPKKWRQYLLGVWRRHQGKPEVAALHQSKLLIARQQIQAWAEENPELKLPVTFDSWYTQPAFCRFLTETVQLPYVGTLSASDNLLLHSGQMSLKLFAAQLKQAHKIAVENDKPPIFKPVTIRYKGTKEQYFSYCNTHRIPKFGKQRLVINFRQADLSDSPVFYISNRLRWQAKGITSIRRHRWPVEVYYEEGKAEGLDQYQLRDFEGISRHIALVTVVYSLLRAAQQDTVLRDQLQRQLKLVLEGTVAFWRRTTEAENLWNLAVLISSSMLAGHSLEAIMASLLPAML